MSSACAAAQVSLAGTAACRERAFHFGAIRPAWAQHIARDNTSSSELSLSRRASELRDRAVRSSAIIRFTMDPNSLPFLDHDAGQIYYTVQKLVNVKRVLNLASFLESANAQCLLPLSSGRCLRKAR